MTSGRRPRTVKVGTEKKDRSINYLVVEAILEYLDCHEKESGKKG